MEVQADQSREVFYLFDYLPKELRDMIWHHALRPDPARPGVHFFSISPKVLEPTDGDGPDARLWFTARRNYGSCNFSPLGAPRSMSNPDVYSWTDGNPSTYCIEWGMWTACKESRGVIKRRYQSKRGQSTTSRPAAELSRSQHPLAESAGGPGWLTPPAFRRFRDGGVDHYLTLLPHLDLICIQPRDSTQKGFVCNLITFVDHQSGYGRYKNIAVELDIRPAVMDQGSSWARNALLDWLELGHADLSMTEAKLWLIDYTIKRRDPGDDHIEVGRAVFYATGRRYIEVHPDASEGAFEEGWTRGEAWFLPCSLRNSTTSHGYVQCRPAPWYSLRADEDYDAGVDIGLLACEYGS